MAGSSLPLRATYRLIGAAFAACTGGVARVTGLGAAFRGCTGVVEHRRGVGENGGMSTEDPTTQTEDPAAVERALRVGLEDFDLSDEDRALLERGDDALDAEAGRGPLPVVAVIGRPNVGKSTLVNRIIGRREAVVEDVPGVTRDRVAYDAEWTGHHFTLVDTGGWAIDASGIHLRVAEQAEIAVDLADVVLFVVDATVGATDDDENCVKLLRRAGKPVVLIANKVDDQRTEADAAALWSLGLGQPWPVSALHGRGSGDALDALLEVMPEVSAMGGAYERGGPRRVALLGRPNVGKSSMLNKLVGHERVVVDHVAGTTRDPVDELVELGGKTWRFVDTAGIRRRVHQTRGSDFYASLRTQTALEKAEVAVVLVDASETITEQDVRVIQQVIDAGRALVIAYNKWDLTDDERRHFLEREIERDLVQIPWAPRANVSARTGPAHGQARARARDGARLLGDPHLHRSAQRLPRRDRRGAPAPGARRQAAPHPLRDPGRHPPAAVRAVRVGLHRGRLPSVRRAPAARGVRLRRHSDRDLGAGAREAVPPLSRQPDAVRARGDSVASARMG